MLDDLLGIKKPKQETKKEEAPSLPKAKREPTPIWHPQVFDEIVLKKRMEFRDGWVFQKGHRAIITEVNFDNSFSVVPYELSVREIRNSGYNTLLDYLAAQQQYNVFTYKDAERIGNIHAFINAIWQSCTSLK